jgi:hypothetical protein
VGRQAPIFYHGYVLDTAFYERDYLGVNRSEVEFDRIVQQYDIDVVLPGRTPIGRSGPLLHRLPLTRPEWAPRLLGRCERGLLRDTDATHAVVERWAYAGSIRGGRAAGCGIAANPARVRAEGCALEHAHNPRALSLRDGVRCRGARPLRHGWGSPCRPPGTRWRGKADMACRRAPRIPRLLALDPEPCPGARAAPGEGIFLGVLTRLSCIGAAAAIGAALCRMKAKRNVAFRLRIPNTRASSTSIR